MPPSKKHAKCLPPKNATEVIQLGDNGRWSRFIGAPAIAFVGMLKRLPWATSDVVVWVAYCDCVHFVKCPVHKALDKACDLYGGASVKRRRPVL